jgi:hypothetical protein
MDLTPKEIQAQYAKALDKIAEMADHISVLEGERDTALTRHLRAGEALAGLCIQLKAEENKRTAAVARTEKAEALLAEATAFSLEPGENSDVWWAFECFHCFHEFGSSGLVFDVRLPVSVELPTAKCPRCGTECEFKQIWGATQSGHGARGDGGLVTRVQELEVQVKRQAAALGRRAKALKTLKDLPAFQESLLMTSEPPVPAEDQLVALRQAMGVLRDVINRSLDPGPVRNDLVRSSEDLFELVEALITECDMLRRTTQHALKDYEDKTRVLNETTKMLMDGRAALHETEAAFARCKIERDRVRVFLRERLLIARADGTVFVGADAALADEPEQP